MCLFIFISLIQENLCFISFSGKTLVITEVLKYPTFYKKHCHKHGFNLHKVLLQFPKQLTDFKEPSRKIYITRLSSFPTISSHFSDDCIKSREEPFLAPLGKRSDFCCRTFYVRLLVFLSAVIAVGKGLFCYSGRYPLSNRGLLAQARKRYIMVLLMQLLR